MLHNTSNEHSVALSFGLNIGYIMLSGYIEIVNIYRTFEIQKEGNIGQSVENIGVCASTSALTYNHKIVICSEVVDHSLFT